MTKTHHNIQIPLVTVELDENHNFTIVVTRFNRNEAGVVTDQTRETIGEFWSRTEAQRLADHIWAGVCDAHKVGLNEGQVVMVDETTQFVTVTEAANRKGVSRQAALSWAKSNSEHTAAVNGKLFIDIDAYMAAKRGPKTSKTRSAEQRRIDRRNAQLVAQATS